MIAVLVPLHLIGEIFLGATRRKSGHLEDEQATGCARGAGSAPRVRTCAPHGQPAPICRALTKAQRPRENGYSHLNGGTISPCRIQCRRSSSISTIGTVPRS